MIWLRPMRAALIAVQVLGSSVITVGTASGQEKTAKPPNKYQQLVNVLPANALRAISPPSLKGRSVAFFVDPVSHAYYIKPMLLPDWEAFRKGLKGSCTADKAPTTIIEIKMQLEVGRDTLRQEIASIAATCEKRDITKDDIFYFPYAWLTVTTGGQAQLNERTRKFPIRTIAEYPADARNGGEVRALLVTEPPPYLAHLYGTCEELRFILENKDIAGNFYAPTKDTQTNAFSVEYSNFAQSRQMESLMRDETATGEQVVVSRSESKGAGVNIGGHFGANYGASEGELRKADTRARTVSANLISDAAMSFAQTVSIKKWVEFPDQNITPTKIQDELVKFVLANAIPVDVQIKRNDDKTWSLVTGAEFRTLTNEEMKQVVESSSKLDINFSEKATIGCSDKKGDGANPNPYCGGVDKKFQGVDDNGIKWQQDGQSWIPTSMKLYAVSQDDLSQASRASIVEVLARDGAMVVDKLQPVATDAVAGTDLEAIIAADITAFRNRANEVLSRQYNLQPGRQVGFGSMQVRGGSGTSNYKDCDPGQFVAGINPYMEDGHLKIVLNCMALPSLQIP